MLLKNKVEIEAWLKQYSIKNYELIENEEYGYIVNVNSDVVLHKKGLKSIDVKFNIIKGSFSCSYNKLALLVGCPEIVNGSFDCSNNKLKSLVGCPKIINKHIYVEKNKLKSLVGCSKIIKGNLYCSNNKLTNLETLINVEIEGNYIDLNYNPELNELQNIKKFNEIKKIVKIYQEKNKLDLLINKYISNKSLESTDFISKVEKINKI